MKAWVTSGLLAFVAGCSDATSPPNPPTVTIVPATNWSGGEVELTSAAFETTGLPVLVVGAETLSVRRTGDSSIAARLPLGPSGSVLIELVHRHQRQTLGTVDRVGYREYRDFTPAFYGEMVTTRRGGTPIVVGTAIPTNGIGGNGEVQYLDVGSMTMTPVPGLYGPSYYGVSPTFRPDQFVLLDSARTPAVWQLWPTVMRADTTPNISDVRHLARLSDSIWLQTGKQFTQAYVNGSPVFGVLGIPTASPWSVFLSPTGATATITTTQGTPGIPIFSTASGDTLYTLGSAFRTAGWAAYSPDGAYVYFLAGVGSNSSLIRVHAATGTVAASIPLTFPAMNLATDPLRPLIYVESLADSTPTIHVLDATALTEVGQLTSPALAGGPRCSYTCWEGAIAVDRVLNRLHVVWIDPRPGSMSSPIWTFDLLP